MRGDRGLDFSMQSSESIERKGRLRLNMHQNSVGANLVWRGSAAIVLAIAAVVAACGPGAFEYAIPYRLVEPTAGGGEGTAHEISAYNEPWEISRTIVAGLQTLQLSVVDPELPPLGILPEAKFIRTDFVPAQAELVGKHNAATPSMGLPLNAKYRFGFRLQYSLIAENPRLDQARGGGTDQRKRIALKIWTRLERSGAAGDWHEYPGPYSGEFFASLVCDAVSTRLHSEHGSVP